MIQKLYNDCLRRGLSTKSVRNLHGVMHKCLHQAVRLQYIRSNPCDACELPRVERQEIHPIEGDAIRAFLAAIKGDPYEELLFVTIFTGLRQGEMLGLAWDAVDFTRRRLPSAASFRGSASGAVNIALCRSRTTSSARSRLRPPS